MFGAIRAFIAAAPIVSLVLALLGSAGTGAAGWFARSVIFDTFERPQIVQAATEKANDACTIRVQAAADAAEKAAIERMTRINQDAITAYREALDAQEAARMLSENARNQERTDHAQALVAAGRSCVFTDDDFDWLRRGQSIVP